MRSLRVPAIVLMALGGLVTAADRRFRRIPEETSK